MPPRGCTSPLVLPWPFCSLPLNRRRRGIRCGVSLKGNIHYSRREERTYQVYSGRVIPLRKNSANVNGVNVRGNERWRWVCEETSWTPFSWYWKISASSTMKWPLPWPWNGCCFGICLHPAQQEWHKGEKKNRRWEFYADETAQWDVGILVKIGFEGALRAEGLICLIILELVNLVISLVRAKGMLDKNEQLQNMTE